MTDDKDEPTRPDESATVDGPTHYDPTAGRPSGDEGGPAEAPGETPTLADVDGGPTVTLPDPVEVRPAAPPPGIDGGPTAAYPAPILDEPTVVAPAPSLADQLLDEETTVVGDEITVVSDEITTTGPTVGGWPADMPEPPPPGELVWRTTVPPANEKTSRAPAYYIALGAAVVLVVGLVAAAAIVSVVKPTREIAGTAQASQSVPAITTTTNAAPPPATSAAPAGPFVEVAAHPLSAATTRMADTTCALPRFDPADDKQAAFFAAAKTCADNAWQDVLTQAGLDGGVQVVTVTATQQTSCGEITPTSPSTHCEGTVYLTPAHLRDTEQNGRYPGKYLGVLLREYAGALQNTTGLTDVLTKVTTGSEQEVDKRLTQQATCLAGVVSGAMAGRGAVDTNITGEIADRLSRVDAPPDAKAWLDKGFTGRTPRACDTWAS